MGFQTYLDKSKEYSSYHFNSTKIVSISDNAFAIEISLMQASKNTLFACLYALFHEYYVNGILNLFR